MLLLLAAVIEGAALAAADAEPLGIALEGYPFPHPVKFHALSYEGEDLRMAYMDVPPATNANGQTVVLLHGANFFGAYWRNTIDALAQAGYRVVVPDQIGFGKSSKPVLPYSFHWLAANTKALLDALGIARVAVVGHSMGGMLATRFSLMYPDTVTHLVLENPIGLEDYREQVPWVPTERVYKGVLAETEDSIRAYHKAYYVTWKPEFDEFVMVHARLRGSAMFPQYARVRALVVQMIYEQPVVHEFPRLRVPAMLVIGQSDRTAVGKARASESVRTTLGLYPELGRRAHAEIPGSRLVELPNVGHTPHLEVPQRFHAALLEFLKQQETGQRVTD
jgi:pimeloyl-ACP methyl ester carboxylesterase